MRKPFLLSAAISQLPSGDIEMVERFFDEKLSFQNVADCDPQLKRSPKGTAAGFARKTD